MNKPLIVIYSTICLDAVGIGLIFPILPRLLEDITHAGNVAFYIGILTALYAFMQFIFAPVLGVLSDRFGRRPVLLISLAGAMVNYVAMAFSSHLWLLLIGRAIAGLTSANISVAMAYITDISTEDQRARRFGLFNAMFGIGFIIGPVIGGILGDYWVRLPFMAAAILVAANFLMALLILPESRIPQKVKMTVAVLNPLQPLRWLFSKKNLIPVAVIFFILNVTGEVYVTCWALWSQDVFQWNGLWIGLSLSVFGICQALAQAFLPGPIVNLLGEKKAILAGIAAESLALLVMVFTEQSWIVFAMMPIFALGGIGIPALQSMATRQVDDDKQGQFQGVLASVVSLASIVGPLVFSTFYSVVRGQWPGAIWLSVVVILLIAIPLVLRLRFSSLNKLSQIQQ